MMQPPQPDPGRPKDQVVHGSPAIVSVVATTGTLSSRANLSLSHIATAALFARKLKRVEESFIADQSRTAERMAEHRSYATSAVVMAAGALEAGINEIYKDAVESRQVIWQGHAPAIPQLLGALWPNVERHPVLAKYDYALVAAQAPQFSRGGSPYQDADNVIKLRDALLHFKPEWSTEQREHKKIEDRLRGKFPENPLFDQGSTFFPDRCLGHGCAKWATESSIRLMDEFCDRMKIGRRFDPVRATLATGRP